MGRDLLRVILYSLLIFAAILVIPLVVRPPEAESAGRPLAVTQPASRPAATKPATVPAKGAVGEKGAAPPPAGQAAAPSRYARVIRIVAALVIFVALAVGIWLATLTVRIFARTVLYVSLVIAGFLTLVPLIWLVACSVKGPEEFFQYTFFPPPGKLSLANFRGLFDQMPFLRLMMNSLFVTGATVMVQLFFSSLGGFALAKYEFRGKKIIMIIMLATMMIPGQVMLAPMYELICRMRFADTYVGLIVPGAVSVFGMFLFRQSMMQLPDELLQAGRIDGCSEFGLYWRIAIPISRPMIGAFCLIAFMGTWNSFLWPQIILQSKELFTLPIALNQLVGLQRQDYGVLMAGTLLSILPVAILFLILQKEFLSGLTAGAVKG